MNRQPVVAGQFYPQNPEKLFSEVKNYLALGQKRTAPTLLSMVPHAGYIFSGKVAGETLGSANLNPILLLLGPNHTGRGAKLSLWPEGKWLFPGGFLQVAEDLAAPIIESNLCYGDFAAHLFEHSLEVILPFLYVLNPEYKILPLCVAEYDISKLQKTALELAQILPKEKVSIVVSSDMSHYISHQEALARDKKAIDKILEFDPIGLVKVVQQYDISMCGILPMVLGLFLAKEWGVKTGSLIKYTTSAETSGDFEQVVGYAGIILE
ncbi:MAG: hypothetical protein PWR24_543 [Desulfonauticus sp.]|jgi:hypothetical protein|nr:MAG: Uncharacterized protein XD41_0529 [Desulfonauticus sp. 38_4375]MDK2920986.1 hypothetical protein [Desulfonauticus sp.]